MGYHQDPIFKTEQGLKFPGFSLAQLSAMRKAVELEYGLISPQLSEAASYSLAMVVRYALGLTAQDGFVGALAGDSFAGQVALATLRHLINSGAQGVVLLPRPHAALSPEVEMQLKPLRRLGVRIHEFDFSESALGGVVEVVQNCHNVMCGLHCAAGLKPSDQDLLIDALNELSTPVHCIDCPPGVDPDSGKAQGSPLYASSTLSVGAPLAGLYFGSDFVGRHYLCDMSISAELYTANGFDISALFAEQPVLRIMPDLIEEQSGA
ncbi:MAG: hypothetical protein K1X83_11455 [Oligoflexia bacterium]|nr:hypothetical protein [Oligoflexia bacterium]